MTRKGATVKLESELKEILLAVADLSAVLSQPKRTVSWICNVLGVQGCMCNGIIVNQIFLSFLEKYLEPYSSPSAVERRQLRSFDVFIADAALRPGTELYCGRRKPDVGLCLYLRSPVLVTRGLYWQDELNSDFSEYCTVQSPSFPCSCAWNRRRSLRVQYLCFVVLLADTLETTDH